MNRFDTRVICMMHGCTFNKNGTCERDLIEINFNGKCSFNNSYLEIKKESNEMKGLYK